MTNLAENLAVTAARYPDQPALRLLDELPKGAAGRILKRVIEKPVGVQS